MVLPVSTVTAQDAFAAMRSQAQQMQTLILQMQAQIASGSVLPDFLLMVLQTAQATIIHTMALRPIPGLAAYAAQALGDPELDLAALLTTSTTALAQFAGALVAEFPHDPATGILQHLAFDAQGAVQLLPIAATALPNTAATAAAFLATIS